MGHGSAQISADKAKDSLLIRENPCGSVARSSRLIFLLEWRRDVLMHDQPFSIFVFPDDGPAEISHFHFSALGSHLFFDGGRGPDEIPVWVHVSIIIDRKLRGLVTGENSFRGLLVFLPTSILQGSNI